MVGINISQICAFTYQKKKKKKKKTVIFLRSGNVDKDLQNL